MVNQTHDDSVDICPTKAPEGLGIYKMKEKTRQCGV